MMIPVARLLKINHSSMLECAKALSQGKAIVYPTETVYGLGVDATNDKAVRMLFRIKGRSAGKPVSIALADIETAKRIAHFNRFTDELARKFLPGPLTLVLKAKKRMPLIAPDGKIGIRIPDNTFLLCLLRTFGKPITSTSANLSGSKSAVSASEVDKKLLKSVEILIRAPRTRYMKESTVVDMTGKTPKILREGAISKNEIMGVLSSVEA